MAVDASLIEADANKQNSTAKEDWDASQIDPADAPDAVCVIVPPPSPRMKGDKTMKRMCLALAFAALAATPVLAFQCPADMSEIDAALETASLSEADLARVNELRALGETEHEAGNHQASVDALAQAKEILGL